MSQGDIAVKKSAKRKNRRKKRRTQDVSDSESSSSSSSDGEGVQDQDQDQDQVDGSVEASVEASVAEMDVVLSDDELPREMSKDTVERLGEVKLTTSDLTGTHGIHLGNIDLQKMAGNLDASREKFQGQGQGQGQGQDKSGLKNEYLSMLFESYGDDMNELRQAPDFTNKTLVMLANVLKDGGDMFDVETLKTVVEGK